MYAAQLADEGKIEQFFTFDELFDVRMKVRIFDILSTKTNEQEKA